MLIRYFMVLKEDFNPIITVGVERERLRERERERERNKERGRDKEAESRSATVHHRGLYNVTVGYVITRQLLVKILEHT